MLITLPNILIIRDANPSNKVRLIIIKIKTKKTAPKLMNASIIREKPFIRLDQDSTAILLQSSLLGSQFRNTIKYEPTKSINIDSIDNLSVDFSFRFFDPLKTLLRESLFDKDLVMLFIVENL